MSGEIDKIIAKAEDFYDDAVYLFNGDRYGAVVLNETFEKRQFGDYDVDAEISNEDAKKVLADADKFITHIRLT